MATSCRIDYLTEEKKYIGEHYSIEIPYEINHDFLLAAHLAAQEGKIPWIKEVLCFSDYGRWWKYEWKEINTLLWKLDSLEQNLDNIAKVIPTPTMIGMSDWRVIVWYESHRKYDSSLEKWIDIEPYSTYVEIWKDWYVNCEKKDIIYIISLIKKLALKAKAIGKPLRFVWE